MVNKNNPRHGSMQFWPRVRAKRQHPRIRSRASSTTVSLAGFAGYKVGMTHTGIRDNDKNSMTKGELISVPATVVECPPMRILSLRVYKPSGYGTAVSQEFFFKPQKEVLRKTGTPSSYAKAEDLDSIELEGVADVTVVLHTQPSRLSFERKKPEIIEMGLGGSVSEKIAFAKERIGKDIPVSDILQSGSYIDVRGVTKGKGFQGPVKRFGIGLRESKSEKAVRAPGSLGGWVGQGHFMYRISHAGTMGYHQRIQYNNYILSISDDVEKVNPEGGFINYGKVGNTYILVKGSVPGSKKRLVAMTSPMRKGKQFSAPTVESVDTNTKQGN